MSEFYSKDTVFLNLQQRDKEVIRDFCKHHHFVLNGLSAPVHGIKLKIYENQLSGER